jgi:site-specific DNA recombinase
MTTTRKRPRGAAVTSLGGPVGPRRIAIYLRRSTDDEHQPFSIEAQDTALLSYTASQPGWTLAAKYTDDASGATTSRPGLQQALRDDHAGRYDVLLVYRVDRFSRRLSDLLDLLSELDDAGVAFASATEPFDTSTSIGRMLVQLLGVFAEFERETIIDRVINGMHAKAAKGKWPGGRPPYGFTVDPPTQTLVADPAEALILDKIFTLYTRDRLGTRAIANLLNDRSVPTRTGLPWAPPAVARILANPAAIGDIAYGQVHVENAHPALIDREVFDRAQAILAARTGPDQQRAASPSDYHLTGLITCPDCGHKYKGTAATGRNGRYRYYTCWTRDRYGTTQGCPAPRLPAELADTAVFGALAAFYAQALIAAAAARYQDHHHAAHATRQAEADVLAGQIKAKEAAITRYLTAFENGTLDDDAVIGDRLRTLRADITRLQARRDQITDAISTQPAAPAVLAHLAGYLHDLQSTGTTPERKAAIEALIHEIRITPEGLIPVFRIPQPGTTIPGQTPSTGHQDAVRPMVHSVGRSGVEPGTYGLKARASAAGWEQLAVHASAILHRAFDAIRADPRSRAAPSASTGSRAASESTPAPATPRQPTKGQPGAQPRYLAADSQRARPPTGAERAIHQHLVTAHHICPVRALGAGQGGCSPLAAPPPAHRVVDRVDSLHLVGLILSRDRTRCPRCQRRDSWLPMPASRRGLDILPSQHQWSVIRPLNPAVPSVSAQL